MTPAAGRALQAATAWQSTPENGISPRDALLGLLAEPESRASNWLASHGVDSTTVQQRWPGARCDNGSRTARRPMLAVELEAALAQLELRMADLPRDWTIATEHLLLAIVLGDDETADWLRQRGVEPERLQLEILARNGFNSGPIELPVDLAPAAPSIAPSATPQSAPHADVRGRAETDITALRIIDAAANRAHEGLRVVEDYVRFGLDDRHLTGLCKELRHDLATLLQRIPLADRLAARETIRDVGMGISTPSEQHRHDLAAIVSANLQRAQQSLRSLEEYAKLRDPATAGEFERLRYRAYTLHGAIENTRNSSERLAGARLYVLLDGRESIFAFETLAASLVASGVHIIQLRDKQLDDRDLLERARVLRRATRDSATLFMMNDRVDLTIASDADGVHLGQDELTVKDARTILGPRRLIGVSTHSIEQARAAVLDGAHYIGVGPTFPSATKEFAAFPGLELIRAVAAEIRLPAFAIGGIQVDRLADVFRAGLRRVAVSAAVVNASDPAAAARAFLAPLSAAV